MRRSPLRNKTPLRRKKPLRASNRFPSKGDPGAATAANEAVPVSLEALRFPKPSRARHPRGANPKVGGDHGPRAAKKSLHRVGADAQPLVALEGQHATYLPKFPKPAPRMKAARAPMERRPMRKALPRRITRPGPMADPAYLAEVRKLPCCAPRGILLRQDMHDCDGPIHAHHAGAKTNDSTAVALCRKHHMQWHDANGVFKGWRKPERREWADAAIDDTRRLIAGRRAA